MVIDGPVLKRLADPTWNVKDQTGETGNLPGNHQGKHRTVQANHSLEGMKYILPKTRR
jgi:hypothetical protein